MFLSLPTSLSIPRLQDRTDDPVRPEPENAIPGIWLAAGALISLVALTALMAWEQLRIDPWAASTLSLSAVAALAGVVLYTRRRPDTRAQQIARDISEYVGLFALICLMGATATYPLSAGSHGFVDPWLQRTDALLHFNWLALYDLVAAHRSLQLLGTIAYQSIYVTPALLLGYFAWANRRAEARLFIVTFWLAAVLTLLLFPFIPAEGPLAFLWRGPIPYMPESALYQASLIPELRQHALHHVDLGALRGLVSAPSFHTASAVLYIAASWSIRPLRWPLLALNLAMLLSTPVEGTHYLTDMIVGAVVAIVALIIVAQVNAALTLKDDG
uniref:phosphatase PAP2 family protein n=1 Tax=Sphingomonas bacterium TaxID=1895847 RepID=UPI0026120947|nr:phosphatase PAP2 family protein [Sphingomonas bacterium]